MTPKYRRNNTLSLNEIMRDWPETIPVLIHFKLLCVGCAVAPFHTIKDACIQHKSDEGVIRDALAKAVRDASGRSTTQ